MDLQSHKQGGVSVTAVAPSTIASPRASSPTQAIHTSSNCFLIPSPSETSLTRSRSLILPSMPKHSPDCKDNPHKF